ncbi:unnamed protein product, partial [Amoebophrya sp. A120]
YNRSVFCLLFRCSTRGYFSYQSTSTSSLRSKLLFLKFCSANAKTNYAVVEPFQYFKQYLIAFLVKGTQLSNSTESTGGPGRIKTKKMIYPSTSGFLCLLVVRCAVFTGLAVVGVSGSSIDASSFLSSTVVPTSGTEEHSAAAASSGRTTVGSSSRASCSTSGEDHPQGAGEKRKFVQLNFFNPSTTRRDSGEARKATFFGAEVASAEERDKFVNNLLCVKAGPRLFYVSPKASLVYDEKPPSKAGSSLPNGDRDVVDDDILEVTQKQIDFVRGMLVDFGNDTVLQEEAKIAQEQEDQDKINPAVTSSTGAGSGSSCTKGRKIPAVVARSPWLKKAHEENLEKKKKNACRCKMQQLDLEQGSQYLLQFDVPPHGAPSSTLVSHKNSGEFLERAILTNPFKGKDKNLQVHEKTLLLSEWVEEPIAGENDGLPKGILKIEKVAAAGERGQGAGLLFMLRIMNYALHKPAEHVAAGDDETADDERFPFQSRTRRGISDLQLDAVRDAHVFWAKMGFVPADQSDSVRFVKTVLVPALAASCSLLEKHRDRGSQLMRMSEGGWRVWKILEKEAREYQM